MNPTLLVGDPSKAPCSFTRFVLPFKYSRNVECRRDAHCGCSTKDAVPPAGVHFRMATEQDWMHAPEKRSRIPEALGNARHRYFAEETGKVIFGDAGWFVLESTQVADGVWQRLELPHVKGEGNYKVAIRPPAMVLFEWNDCGHDPCETESDLLQTGFLILEAYFPGVDEERPSPADLLQFNELFRYWLRPFIGHDSLDKWGEFERKELGIFQKWSFETVRSDDPPPAGSASNPLGSSESAPSDPAEFKLYLRRWEELLRLPIWSCGATHRLEFGPEPPGVGEPRWAINLDSRTFVAACAIVEEDASVQPKGSLLGPLRDWSKQSDPPANIGYWLRLLNVDAPAADSGQTTFFEQEWVKEHTYRRWLHYGCAYGFSDHSAAMLSGFCDDPPTWRHFRAMYFDQVLLMLYVRYSLFRMSRRLSELSERLRACRRSRETRELDEEFSHLRSDFDIFTNLYQFPLLSTQQQSVEMYLLLRYAMDIEILFKEIENQIDGSHEVLEMRAMKGFTKLGVRLAVASLAAGCAGFWGIFQNALNQNEPWGFWSSLGPALAFTLFTFLVSIILATAFWRWIPEVWRLGPAIRRFIPK